MEPVSTPEEALALFGLETAPLRFLSEDGGLVNQTWAVGTPPRLALQRVSAVFSPETHARIQLVTRHLGEKGILTPAVSPAPDGSPCLPGPEGTSWRLMRWIAGVTIHRVERPSQARSMAHLVAGFHEAIADLPELMVPLRGRPHDTPAHMARLEVALEKAGEHRLGDEIRRVAESILEGWACLRRAVPTDDTSPRPAHGDLKVSNIRFDAESREPICLIDLDTLGPMPLPLELGDALRSWCNTSAEDAEPNLDLQVFKEAVEGYAERAPWLTEEEGRGLVPALWRICLELAARFCVDAYEERYFAWNPRVAPSWGEHNLLRARSQLSLARQVEAARSRLTALVPSPLGG